MKKDKVFYAKAITQKTTCYDFMTLLTKPIRELKGIYKWLKKLTK